MDAGTILQETETACITMVETTRTTAEMAHTQTTDRKETTHTPTTRAGTQGTITLTITIPEED